MIAFFMELSLKKLCFGTGSAFILLRIVCFRSEADFFVPESSMEAHVEVITIWHRYAQITSHFRMKGARIPGLIGRNGRGKTTLLRLLMGGLSHEGSIVADTAFDYFPYALTDADLASPAEELAAAWKPGIQSWEILTEMNQMGMDAACLYRPFGELSHGERTRLMLCVLFAREGEFLLIDEPTNHLDGAARESVKTYLAAKKGFLLVSHDRDLIDAVVDHVLVLNRETVEVQAGNFSSWWENKERSDACAVSENEKHLREIRNQEAAGRCRQEPPVGRQ